MTATQVAVEGGAAAPPSGLWKHQQEAVDFLMQRRGGILEAGLGAGKTRVAFELARQRGVSRLLVCCPKGVAGHWVAQAKKWVPELPVLDLSDGPVANRVRQLERFDRPGIVVINYDVLSPRPALSKIAARVGEGKGRVSPPEALTQALGEWVRGGLLVADEVHHLMAPTGKQSQAAAVLGQSAYRLGLSGTPLGSKPLGAWGILRFAAPDVFGPNYVLFKRRYTKYVPIEVLRAEKRRAELIETGRGGAATYWDYVDLEHLRERFYTVTFQCDGAPEIPVTDVVRNFDLEPEIMRFYRRFERELAAECSTMDGAKLMLHAKSILSAVGRLQQITSGDIPDTREDDAPVQLVSRAKRNALVGWMEELPSVDEPAVVFCRFRPDIDAVHAAAKETGRTSLEVSGRRHQLEEWKVGGAPVLACNIDSGSEGVELHRARYACYYSLSRSLLAYQQSRGRLARPDQVSPWVHYTHLVARNTIDEEVYEAFGRGEEILERVYQRRRQ